MSGNAVAKLAKPQLRGLLDSYIKKTFVIATVGSVIVGIGYQLLIRDKHTRRRENFYATFDAEKEYQRLKNLGLFWRIRPKDESKAIYKKW